MKTKVMLKLTHKVVIPPILVLMAAASSGYGTTPQHVRRQAKGVTRRAQFHDAAAQKTQDHEWYHRPSNPGYHPNLGS